MIKDSYFKSIGIKCIKYLCKGANYEKIYNGH